MDSNPKSFVKTIRGDKLLEKLDLVLSTDLWMN